MGSFNKKLWIGLLVLALLSPLGIILPKIFHAGKPWGEWSTEEVAKEKGYTPKGMQKDARLYKAPAADYNLGNENDSLWKRSGSYILSGIVGLSVISLITYGVLKITHRR
ncbi:MAG TPA: PDGLE domain-containing protein [Bacteroidales bacterium]